MATPAEDTRRGRASAAPEVTVFYDRGRCRHYAQCVRGLPQVFDPTRRPWIRAELADPNAIAEVVRRCPTGALHYRLPAEQPEAPTHPTSITRDPRGPLLVRGDLVLDTPEGPLRECNQKLSTSVRQVTADRESRREDTMTFLNLSLGSPVVRAAETVTGELGVVGARFIMSGDRSDGRFSLVEHPIVPRGLAAPVHIHRREDEFSFVLEGRWGFQLGSDVVYAGPGDLVYKPRDVWHTFWNATDTPARLLEIISPAGFEQLFVELADLLRTDPGNLEANAALGAKYGVESDPEATARVVGEHGLIERLG